MRVAATLLFSVYYKPASVFVSLVKLILV